ncbi:DNA-binding SARP family transcriptional activator [Agrococcus sp. UYP10]
MDGSSLSVHVLGRFTVEPESRLASGAARTVAYLALADGRASRDEVAEALWPFAGRQQSRANLRKSVWQIPDGLVDASNGELRLRADIDIIHAHAAAASALSGDAIEFADVQLLSYDVLTGWYDEWIDGFRDAFASLRVAALETACRTLIERGRALLAVRAGEAALAADPFRESAALALIGAHLAQGNRHAAASLGETFAARLQNELGLRPAAQFTAAIRRAGGVTGN